MQGASSSSDPERIGFLLVSGFSAMAFFSAIEPLRVANRLAGRPLYNWRIYALHADPVEASNGMRLVPDMPFGAERPPTLIVCAGFHPERAESKATLATLRKFARAGVRLGALDTGAHVLAKAGLLDGSRVSIHWEAAPAFQEEFPGIEVTGELFEVHERMFTCAGGTAALDLMLAMIGARHGPGLACAVSEQFIHDRIRTSHDHQRMELAARLQVHNEKVLQVVELMERYIEQVMDVPALAEAVSVTPRQLERLFENALGQSPAHYYRNLRLDRAQHLLRETGLSVVQVAIATGFNSASSLSRAYRDCYGRSPSSERRAGTS
ncbi:MAG TPA: GlxA family transcriptional regulator [Burkholderiaceae bacterium]|jgi:AraC family carnitine catabolism transcriptional activator|nr:GlxA family transcriptional regulator [Burkholderiaceae bacterium]